MKRRWNLLVPAGLLVTLLGFPSGSWAQLPPSPPPKRERARPPAIKTPQVGEKAPDFTLPDRYGAAVTLSQLLAAPAVRKDDGTKKGPWVLLVFYRGYWCAMCNADLRSFQDRLKESSARGVRIVAISTDPPDVARKYADKQGFAFTLLSDSQAEVIRRYNLLREGSGPRGADVARPGQFLIDSSRTLRWVNLNEDMSVRVRPENILGTIDELTAVSSSPGK